MPIAKRNKNAKLRLPCDDPDDIFYARYTNMGEPYREGIEIGVENTDNYESVSVMLCDYEAKLLRDMLIKHYPIK
jgi:hypothetical protein